MLLRSLNHWPKSLDIKRLHSSNWTRAIVSRSIWKPWPANIIPGTSHQCDGRNHLLCRALRFSTQIAVDLTSSNPAPSMRIAIIKPLLPPGCLLYKPFVTPSIILGMNSRPIIVIFFWQHCCQGVWAWPDTPGLLRTLCSHRPDTIRRSASGS